MPGYRLDRLTADIQREVSEILRGVKDPRIKGLISVVKVDVSNDLSYAKIYFSNIGGDVKEAAKGLSSASGYVRKELSSRLNIRKTPELKFISDDSIEQSARIAKLIENLESH